MLPHATLSNDDLIVKQFRSTFVCYKKIQIRVNNFQIYKKMAIL